MRSHFLRASSGVSKSTTLDYLTSGIYTAPVSVSLGDADDDRYIIVAVSCYNNTPTTPVYPSSVLIDSSSLALVVSDEGFSVPNSLSSSISIWIVKVTSGTSGTLTVNFSVSPVRTEYSIYRLVTTHGSSPYSTASSSSSGGSPLSLNLSAASKSACLGACSLFTPRTRTPTTLWTGLTRDVNLSYISTASIEDASPGSLSVSVSSTQSFLVGLVAASWS